MATTKLDAALVASALVLAACSGGKESSLGKPSGAGGMSGAGTPGMSAGTGGTLPSSGGAGVGGSSAGHGNPPSAGAAGNAGAAGHGVAAAGGMSTAGAGGSSAGLGAAGTMPVAGSAGDVSTAGSSNAGGASDEPLGTPTEVALPDLDAVRQEHSVVAVGGKVYVIGGYVNNTISASVLAYDPTAMKYTSVADFPGPLNHGNAGAVNGMIYVAGCYVSANMSTATTENYGYDPATDKWTAKAPLPDGTERAAACVAVDGGYMYVIGGAHDGMSVDDVARYDAAADKWETLAKLPERREHCAAGAIGGIIYVGGGRVDGITGFEPKTWAYDPAADQWTEKAPINPARGGLAGAVLDNRLIVFGGEGNSAVSSGVFPDIDAYDPVTDSWEKLGDMQFPRHGYGAALLDDRIYLLGGATKQGGNPDKKSSVFYFE